MKINKNNLYLAEIKWFDKEQNGVEVEDSIAYSVICRDDEDSTYFNIFNLTEAYPVFERSKTYSNCTDNGVEYGTKMIYKGGMLETGLCWIVEPLPIEKDNLEFRDIEEFILNDERYFKDREQIALKYLKKNPIKMLRIIHKDNLKKDKMLDILVEKNQKTKKLENN